MGNSNIFIYLILSVAGLIISIFVVRAIFSIPELVRLHRAQVQLLAEIALACGTKPEIIKSVMYNHNVDSRSETNSETRERLEHEKEEIKPTQTIQP